jgi:hypothetical protein
MTKNNVISNAELNTAVDNLIKAVIDSLVILKDILLLCKSKNFLKSLKTLSLMNSIYVNYFFTILTVLLKKNVLKNI